LPARGHGWKDWREELNGKTGLPAVALAKEGTPVREQVTDPKNQRNYLELGGGTLSPEGVSLYMNETTWLMAF